MPLDGLLRPGSGGAGSRVLRFLPVPFTNDEIVSASAFGIAGTAAGTAVVGCSVTPGLPHSPLRQPQQEQLRLVRLTATGQEGASEDGPVGRGIWLGAAPGDAFYALAVRGAGAAGAVLAYRWGAPGQGNWPTLDGIVNERLFARALLAGVFAAGVGPNGSLYIVASSARELGILEIRPDGSRERFDQRKGRPLGVRLVPGVQRLVFDGDGRMLVICSGRPSGRPPKPRAMIRSLSVEGSSVAVDPGWGRDGGWTGPPNFAPVDLLVSPEGTLLCPGWLRTGAKVGFSVVHIAADGLSEDVPGMGAAGGGVGLVDEPIPSQIAVDASGGLLVATTIPNPISVFLQGLPEWGLVARRNPAGEPDVAFGNQGLCFAEHQGYPLGVRGLAATGSGFFLACDRRADIQWNDTLPLVFAFTASGHAQPGFGDVGIVHHEEIPAEVVFHDAPDTVAVGVKRIWNPAPLADEFEIAVTRIWSTGRVRWQYGTSHGLRSAGLFVAGQRVQGFGVEVVTSWRGLWAIGGWAAAPANSAFVTFRDWNGNPYPGGQGTTLAIGDQIQSLVALPDGSLEVVYRVGSPVTVWKARITPALTLDPTPPVAVPHPPSGLPLPDGSRVQARIPPLSDLGNSYLFRMWLVRILPDDSFDSQFGGGGNTAPVDLQRQIQRAGFGRQDAFDLPGGVLALPGGGYTAIVRLRKFFPNRTVPVPTGILATRWDANGMPEPAWGNGVSHPGFVVVREVLVDHPTRIVVIGAFEGGAQGSRTPALLGLRTSDGALDPSFGAQGELLVPLRGSEQRVAQASIRRSDGTTARPVRLDDEGTVVVQPALIWLDVI